jgi:chromosome segregation ATPase
VSELSLQKDEELKRFQDQERQASVRLREQDTLINELQEKLDLVEDELKGRKKDLDKLRTNESRYYYLPWPSSDCRMQEIVRSMEKEVEARELELSSWRDRYNNVKKSYDEQLAEADKLRDMILNKEGENNLLKEKINSLQEDIDTVSIPNLLPHLI